MREARDHEPVDLAFVAFVTLDILDVEDTSDRTEGDRAPGRDVEAPRLRGRKDDPIDGRRGDNASIGVRLFVRCRDAKVVPVYTEPWDTDLDPGGVPTEDIDIRLEDRSLVLDKTRRGGAGAGTDSLPPRLDRPIDKLA